MVILTILKIESHLRLQNAHVWTRLEQSPEMTHMVSIIVKALLTKTRFKCFSSLKLDPDSTRLLFVLIRLLHTGVFGILQNLQGFRYRAQKRGLNNRVKIILIFIRKSFGSC